MSSATSASILIRPNASYTAGSGHAIRCLALASALTDRGAACTFAITAEAVAAVPALTASGHRLVPLADGDDPAALKAAAPEGTDWLVVDHYGLGRNYESACQPWAKRVMVLDDMPRAPHACDLLLDQNLGCRAEDYRALVPAHCRILAGSDYALLRPGFAARRAKSLSRRTDGHVRRVLVSFGGGNPDDLTEPVVTALTTMCRGLPVDVVVGPHWPGSREMQARLRALTSVTVHCDPPDMAELMAEADLSVGAAGSMSWERCALGLPSLVVVAADNQEGIAAHLAAAGAARFVGRVGEVSAISIAAAVAGLIGHDDILVSMSAASAAICDGGGAMRVAEEMLAGDA